MRRKDRDRALYLAVIEEAYLEHFDTAEGRDLVADEALRLLVFVPEQEEISQWIESHNIESS